jgi:hypothetical protein
MSRMTSGGPADLLQQDRPREKRESQTRSEARPKNVNNS